MLQTSSTFWKLIEERVAKQRAIDVSSVHSPGLSLNGPPPTMSFIGLNDPGGFEFERRADSVSYRQSQQAATISLNLLHRIIGALYDRSFRRPSSSTFAK